MTQNLVVGAVVLLATVYALRALLPRTLIARFTGRAAPAASCGGCDGCGDTPAPLEKPIRIVRRRG
jgi:hypothetical protein